MNLFDWVHVDFLALSVSLSLWKTRRLQKKNISVWVMGRAGRGGAERVLEISCLVGLVLWILLILALATGNAKRVLPAFFIHPLFEVPAFKVTALFLLVLSLTFHFLGLQCLGPNWRVGVREEHPGQLVTHGIYARTRNPIMLCLLLYALAVWLTYSNLLTTLMLLIVTAAVHHQVRKEEVFLAALHGQLYLGYQQRVPRFIPLPRGG